MKKRTLHKEIANRNREQYRVKGGRAGGRLKAFCRMNFREQLPAIEVNFSIRLLMVITFTYYSFDTMQSFSCQFIILILFFYGRFYLFACSFAGWFGLLDSFASVLVCCCYFFLSFSIRDGYRHFISVCLFVCSFCCVYQPLYANGSHITHDYVD